LKASTRGARPVLLIEDDPATRDAMRALLAGAGHRVIASDEGRKALELAAVVMPSAVVLDLVMSGMDGWEFLDRRRSVPQLERTPVIVITGAPGVRVEAAQAVLSKPFEHEVLLSTLRHLVGAPARAG
jgi:two-component system, OmpR family, alkaline phosphatase synthesis response regulator PhoP